jgi:hypothetical protein
VRVAGACGRSAEVTALSLRARQGADSLREPADRREGLGAQAEVGARAGDVAERVAAWRFTKRDELLKAWFHIHFLLP